MNKEDIETSKRIFIVKPEKDIKNTTETEEKKTETSSSVPTQNHTEKDKNIPVFKESMKLINIDSSDIIPKLKEINTAKITGMGKEIILKGTLEEINELKYII